MDIQIFSDMHCFLQCHVICTAHCILAHRSFKKSVWGLACISGRFRLFTLSDNESPAKSRGSTNYELKNGLGFKVLEVLQLGAVPQNVLPATCWTNSWHKHDTQADLDSSSVQASFTTFQGLATEPTSWSGLGPLSDLAYLPAVFLSELYHLGRGIAVYGSLISTRLLLFIWSSGCSCLSTILPLELKDASMA